MASRLMVLSQVVCYVQVVCPQNASQAGCGVFWTGPDIDEIYRNISTATGGRRKVLGDPVTGRKLAVVAPGVTGSAPQGTTVTGSAPQGTTVTGSAPQGTTVAGSRPEGGPPSGPNPADVATEGCTATISEIHLFPHLLKMPSTLLYTDSLSLYC